MPSTKLAPPKYDLSREIDLGFTSSSLGCFDTSSIGGLASGQWQVFHGVDCRRSEQLGVREAERDLSSSGNYDKAQGQLLRALPMLPRAFLRKASVCTVPSLILLGTTPQSVRAGDRGETNSSFSKLASSIDY